MQQNNLSPAEVREIIRIGIGDDQGTVQKTFLSDLTIQVTMCWGAGLPSSGKLAESRDMGTGSNMAYFDFLIFITDNSNRNYI